MESGKAFHRKGLIIIKPDLTDNMEYVASLNDGLIDDVPISYEYSDPRKARPRQRRLFFALLGDIYKWSGQPIGDAKEYFYARFQAKTAGKEISLKDTTTNTVSDATKLIDDVIDFIFENHVPVNEAYPLLPRDENHFQYDCIKHQSCLICGRHADIHHLELKNGNAVGMGMNRKKVDHSRRYLVALCRAHHQEIHQLGTTDFCRKYHFTNIGIMVRPEILKRIGIVGDYSKRGEQDGNRIESVGTSNFTGIN